MASDPSERTVQVDFYHLTRMPLERALPQVAEKVVANGARLLIVAPIDPSVDPSASYSVMSRCRSSPSFTSVDHITPDDAITFSEGTS